MHDGEILNISIDRSIATASLILRQENGEERTIELNGLKAFRCSDMVLQNVVNRVLRSSKNEISSGDLHYWLNWVTSLSDASSWLSDTRKQEWIDVCTHGVLELIVIEPSAGAEIAAVCEKFAIV